MLTAEIHGHYIPEARFSEDYLTSSVFGHLRYIAPGPFWENLLTLAVSMPMEGISVTAADFIAARTGGSIAEYSTLDTLFWPQHPKGTPDIVLWFRSEQGPSAVLIVEAKLESGKSGHDEQDQLARYLQICDSLDQLHPSAPKDSVSIVIYLTGMDSRSDLAETLRVVDDRRSARERLYRLQWQDVVISIETAPVPESRLEQLVLRDVAAFLRRRDLDYFRGMPVVTELPMFSDEDGGFTWDEPVFNTVDIDTNVDNIREPWNDYRIR